MGKDAECDDVQEQLFSSLMVFEDTGLQRANSAKCVFVVLVMS